MIKKHRERIFTCTAVVIFLIMIIALISYVQAYWTDSLEDFVNEPRANIIRKKYWNSDKGANEG